MVYVLRHVEYGETLILGYNKTYSLGRSRRNSIHLADETTSIRHANLNIGDDSVELEDLHSDFGTWINKQKLNGTCSLTHGDVIIFGKQNCKYVFLEPKFEAIIDKKVTNATQCMLVETLKELNVSLKNIYTRNCSHYIVEYVTLDTLKEKTILYSLIDRKTVITPNYFTNILQNIKEAPLMPNIYRYMPEIDSQLKSKGIEGIDPRRNRRHIFDNLFFIFFDKKCDRDLTDIVLTCGGDSLTYSSEDAFLQKVLKLGKTSSLILVNHQSNGKKTSSMQEFIKSLKKKRIKVSLISSDDLFISVLKAGLVDLQELSKPAQNSIAESQPSTSQLRNSDESDPVGIDMTITKPSDSWQGKLQPLNTFSRLAAGYKTHKSVKEMILTNRTSSSTLTRWLKRIDKDPSKKMTPNGSLGCNNKVMEVLTSDDDETDELDLSNNPERRNYLNNIGTKNEGNGSNPEESSEERTIVQTSFKTSVTVRNKKRKVANGLVSVPERMIRDAKNDMICSRKRKKLLINPFAMKKTSEGQEDSGNHQGSSAVEHWKQKFKNIDIIPIS